MKKRRNLIIGLIIFLVLIVGVAFGTKRFIDQKVANNQRIVATSAAITEIFAKLDINLVGVPKTQAKIPARYAKVTKIGNPMKPSIEKIASLNPTHVYAVSTLKDQYDDAFKEQSMDVTYLKLDSVAQLEGTLTSLGKKYYRQRQAAQQVKIIQNAVNQAKKRVHGKKPSVLILMGLPGANYMILTNKSYLGNLVQIAGGKNVYQSSSQIYLSPSNESLATKNPDVILRLEHALPNVTLPQFKEEFKKNPVWHKMKAVKDQRVYDLQQPDFNASANMNVPQALHKLSRWLYPTR
ncbi:MULTISPECIES: heme ABC transporter substrate-binding protein IsdE [Lactobacillus]|uniref:heme ABC transporter substrate-binding protein IsdE n=1 Tax=Lactobacillus TaxID=1578 RepID=UPI000CD9DDFB|nr:MULTISPECIES: heme ABC transporter substrate-binding protein IsdE [Lactobacillus]RVU72066.1 heme ABC transporter substrate-binding protein IsdE [Lactobacillus xujianguonis]